ncbi:MAG: universal stress protein [Bacteroidales bacterium]|nr:universal stress protein [Bacteroidales bacterium]
MKTILIPVDFSDNSLITCKYAIKIAGQNHLTKLHLLHIYPDQLMIPDSSFPSGIDSDAFMNVQFIEELRNQSEESMKSLVSDLEKIVAESKQSNLIVTHSITGGDPEWEIRNACEELKPEIIVMGTHGTGKKGFLEGIMAEKIMDHTTVPVIAVPASVKNCNISNIMYASNGSEKDYAKIKLLLKLFEETAITISVVHFLLENKAKDKDFMRNMEDTFMREGLNNQVHFFSVDAVDKQEALNTFVVHQHIDTIAFIAQKSNLFKSLFSNKLDKKDFFKLELPMLALHE